MSRVAPYPEQFAENPVDLGYLRRFTRGDPSFETEIVTLFREHTREMLDKLSCTNEPAEWRICAHTIKGSAHTIGALSLSAAAGRAEAASEVRRREALADLERAFAEVCAYLDAISPGPSGAGGLP